MLTITQLSPVKELLVGVVLLILAAVLYKLLPLFNDRFLGGPDMRTRTAFVVGTPLLILAFASIAIIRALIRFH
jgi:drug/metabolite transporter (DMT)-like permease